MCVCVCVCDSVCVNLLNCHLPADPMQNLHVPIMLFLALVARAIRHFTSLYIPCYFRVRRAVFLLGDGGSQVGSHLRDEAPGTGPHVPLGMNVGETKLVAVSEVGV